MSGPNQERKGEENQPTNDDTIRVPLDFFETDRPDFSTLSEDEIKEFVNNFPGLGEEEKESLLGKIIDALSEDNEE